jgi:hypothetical protein
MMVPPCIRHPEPVHSNQNRDIFLNNIASQSENRTSHSVLFDMGFMRLAATLISAAVTSDSIIVNISGIVVNMCGSSCL